MEYWLLCVIVSILATIVGKFIWKHELDIGEMAATVFVASIVSAILIGASTYRDRHDVQVLNGQVTNKFNEKVHCRHSYDCHCYTSCSGSGKHRSCTRHCSTCYEHSYDVDWTVRTSLGDIGIDKVDRRGLSEPPRWTAAIIGEPAQKLSSYTNYVKGAPESLFNHALLVKNKLPIPDYPSVVYDYYRHNRIVLANAPAGNYSVLNDMLNNELKTLGFAKKVNIVPVFTQYDENYARALEAKWLGGKRNDVVIVMGLSEKTIKFVRVFSWSRSSLINYEIQNQLMDMKILDYNQYVARVSDVIKKQYVQRNPEDFKYLEDSVRPSDWVVATSIAFCVFGSLILSFWFSAPHRRFN